MEQKSLLSQIKLNLTDFHKKKIELIDNFDYSNVVWKVRQESSLSKDYIMQGINNLKRYYVVALLDPLNEHAVSDLVDPFWHTHILFTKEYVNFCNEIFQGYIHHTPLNQSHHAEVKKVENLYGYTIDTYNKIFHTVDQNWWPELGFDNDLKVNMRPICTHYLIKDTEIMKNALFSTHKQSTSKIAADTF